MPLRIHALATRLTMLSLTLLAFAGTSQAHGSMEIPLSRVYNCFLENPENPKSAACRAAVAAGGTQQFYDWNGVNRLEANGRHRQIVPDGKLCSAGKDTFKGLDLARSDWPSKTIAADGSGNFKFTWHATAPHATRDMSLYVTRNGYDPTKPLAWADLEDAPFCSFPSLTLVNGRYEMTCRLPQGKTGKHVIYAIWQRSDSTEAFYSCSDVQFGATAPTVWRQLGQLRAQQALPVGTKVTFRLFDAFSRDVESYSVTLKKGMTSAANWPYHLATAVNAASRLVNVGVLDTAGRITPVKSASDNTVYVNSSATYSFQVDVEQPGPGGPPGGGTGGGTAQFVYPNGLGSYTAGTVVRATDGANYQCRPYPNSGWCNGWDLYYAPGTGLAWADAWERLP